MNNYRVIFGGRIEYIIYVYDNTVHSLVQFYQRGGLVQLFVTCEHIQRVRCLHEVPQATLVRGLIVPRLAQVERRQWRLALRLSVFVAGW